MDPPQKKKTMDSLKVDSFILKEKNIYWAPTLCQEEW